MADTPTYKSTLTGPELDEALRNIGNVQANIEKAAGYAETAEQYGTIVQQYQTAIQAIEDNLADILGAAQNAIDAKNAASSAAASASAASQSATDAKDAAKRAEAAAGVNPNDYYQKTEADQRFQMPIGFYFDWAPVSGGPDLSTAQKVAAHFGYGTWKEISGVFMLSRSSSHAVGSTGGEENHTLTTNEIPNHNHRFATNAAGSTQFPQWYFRMQGVQQTQAFQTYADFTLGTGGGKSHNNMPPYLTCYRWQRIA